MGHYSSRVQLKFFDFQSYGKQYRHWLSLILKANQIHWFSRLRKQFHHWLPSIMKANQFQCFPQLQGLILTLAFTNCESNPISKVVAIAETIFNIGFRSL